MRSEFRLLFFLAAALWLAKAPAAQAARFLRAQITVNGKPVLEANFGAPDVEDAARTWARLEELTFMAVSEVAPSGDDPLKADLTGEVRISIGLIALASATTDRLQLVRAGGGWRLPAAEVERTARAAGLDITKMRDSLPTMVIAGALVAMALIGIGGWLVWRRLKQ